MLEQTRGGVGRECSTSVECLFSITPNAHTDAGRSGRRIFKDGRVLVLNNADTDARRSRQRTFTDGLVLVLNNPQVKPRKRQEGH
jgi:hypothetical protein